jgi:hypothetical protein
MNHRDTEDTEKRWKRISYQPSAISYQLLGERGPRRLLAIVDN